MCVAMKLLKSILLITPCFIFFSSYGAQEPITDPNSITSATINWKQGEHVELIGTRNYRRWIREFGVVDTQLAKKLGNDNHSIRHAHIDVRNDGQPEIIVQEGLWTARGYALAVFQKNGKEWAIILQHRGAFIFDNSKPKTPYKLTLIDKDGNDYGRYEFVYGDRKYKLVKKIVPYLDISFEQFWDLNSTKEEQLIWNRRLRQ